MPPSTLTPRERRELILRTLAGENRARLAEEYAVSEDTVYRAARETRKQAREQLEFWQKVEVNM